MTVLLALQDNNAQQFQTTCFITLFTIITIIIFVAITEKRNCIMGPWKRNRKQSRKKRNL